MKKGFLVGMAAVLAMGASVSMAGAPPFSGQAQLAQPVAAPSEVQVDGVTWRCEGDKCEGRAERRSTLDSHIKECRKVAAALGELTSYSSRGREMTKRSVDTCNRLAASDKEEMVAKK